MTTDKPMGRDMPDDRRQREVIARGMGMSVVTLSGVAPSESVLNSITPELARRYGVFPVECTPTTLTVAVANPMDCDAVDSLRYILKTNVHAAYCDPEQLQEAIARYYGKDPT